MYWRPVCEEWYFIKSSVYRFRFYKLYKNIIWLQGTSYKLYLCNQVLHSYLFKYLIGKKWNKFYKLLVFGKKSARFTKDKIVAVIRTLVLWIRTLVLWIRTLVLWIKTLVLWISESSSDRHVMRYTGKFNSSSIFRDGQTLQG